MTVALIEGRSNGSANFAADPSVVMQVPSSSLAAPVPIVVRVDCEANPRAQSAVLRVLDIPAGFKVVAESVILDTKEGATLTVDVGTYYIPNALGVSSAAISAAIFHDNLNLNTTDDSGEAIGSPTASTGAPLAETQGDKCVGILFNNAAASAKFDLVVELLDMRATKGGDTSTVYANVG